MKIIAVAAVALLLAGCGADEKYRYQEDQPTTNPNQPVTMLFEHDGCKVYRFSDKGNWRYYVHCRNGVTNTSWRRGCGKNCWRYEEINTQ